MKMTYDLIILGGGPAGTAASVYAARKKMRTLFITAEWGGQSTVSEQIYNWVGTTSLSGADLAENFKKHVLANSGDTLEVKEGSRVQNIQKEEDKDEKHLFKVSTDDGQEYLTKTILISTGSARRKLPAKNADKLEHKGLTYCASCDGPIFADMDVAVIGGGNAAFESASQLLAYCKSVTLFIREETFRADEVTVEKVLKNPKMNVVKNADILEVLGEKFVEGIKYKDKKENVEKELKVSGIFVEIGQIPATSFAKDIVPLDQIGRIKIDPWTSKTETEGIWAAGDCTNVLYHQNNIAAGDGVKALEDIYIHLHAK
ncbi:MAG: FAD-dependent oxidoreductase [Candidatus Pacebacteria bacterium]|nr:FAD-dependent oxidoreductase [Candidatus Paceibacterota bacterium]MCF7863023.1 FAD-dependent oxidoreductase [Candidatus Paceibacterota bacterium]